MSDRLQYFHAKPSLCQRRYTVAVEVTTGLEEILKAKMLGITNADYAKVSVNVGYSLCSRLDNFNKQTGRDLSSSRIKRQWYKLKTLDFEDDLFIATLRMDKKVKDAPRLLQFRISYDKTKIPYFIFAS